jgi:hypothetical protein
VPAPIGSVRRRLADWFEGRWRRPDVPFLMSGRAGPGPDFLVIGALGGGTDWLFDQLDHHPDFWMPPIDELHYFDQAIRVDRIAPLLKSARRSMGRINHSRRNAKMRPLSGTDLEVLEALEWLQGRPIDFDLYAKLFEPKGRLRSGDVSPTYSILDEATIRDIFEHFPKAKAVFIARDPVQRLWAHYSIACRERDWPLTADWNMVERFMGTTAAAEYSRITEAVRRWRQLAPEGQLGVFFFDQIATDPKALRAQILTFLGADPAKPSGALRPDFRRKSNEEIPMSREARELLAVTFADELRACARELGGPAVEWPERYNL